MFVTIILTGFHMLFLHLFVQGEVLQVFLLKCEITVSSVNSKQTLPASPCLLNIGQVHPPFPHTEGLIIIKSQSVCRRIAGGCLPSPPLSSPLLLTTLLMSHKNKVTHLPAHEDVWRPGRHWLVYRCSFQCLLE